MTAGGREARPDTAPDRVEVDAVATRRQSIDLDDEMEATGLILDESSPPDRGTRSIDQPGRGVRRTGCRDGADREAEQRRDHETAEGLPYRSGVHHDTSATRHDMSFCDISWRVVAILSTPRPTTGAADTIRPMTTRLWDRAAVAVVADGRRFPAV